MIPTSYKSKLPRTLSYPLGAKAISDALGDAPHVEELDLSFSAVAIDPAAEFRRVIRESLPYRILRAEFKPESRPGYSGATDMIERGWYDPHWNLWVYPVLRELRHKAGELLRVQGLPMLVDWLRESSRAGWLSHKHKFALVFDPIATCLAVDREDGA